MYYIDEIYYLIKVFHTVNFITIDANPQIKVTLSGFDYVVLLRTICCFFQKRNGKTSIKS